MRDATIEQSAEPKDPDNADTLPPPGAGVFNDTLSKKSLSNISSLFSITA